MRTSRRVQYRRDVLCRLAVVARDSFPAHASLSLRRTLYKGARAPLFAAVVSNHSGKCYCSPGERRSDPSGSCEQRETPSRLARLVCCSPAPRGALLASRWRFPGEALSRESLTQDSRSAVKARLFDPLRESFGEERCTPRGDGVMAFERPSRGFEPFVTRRNALESRADRGMRAYVTGGDPPVDDAQTSAMRARYGLTPRRVASSRLAAHERREGLAQHAPHGGGDLGVGLG